MFALRVYQVQVPLQRQVWSLMQGPSKRSTMIIDILDDKLLQSPNYFSALGYQTTDDMSLPSLALSGKSYAYIIDPIYTRNDCKS